MLCFAPSLPASLAYLFVLCSQTSTVLNEVEMVMLIFLAWDLFCCRRWVCVFVVVVCFVLFASLFCFCLFICLFVFRVGGGKVLKSVEQFLIKVDFFFFFLLYN